MCFPGRKTSGKHQENIRKTMRKHTETHSLTGNHHPETVVCEPIVERTHLRVKAIAEHIDNTTTFERSVLSGLCSVMVHDSDKFTADGLLGKTAVWPGFSPMVTVAGRMLIFGFEVSEDDVVLCGSALGIVLACAQQETELFVVVATLTHVRNITDHSLTCSRSDGRAVWRACEVVQALAWQEQAGGVLHIVRR